MKMISSQMFEKSIYLFWYFRHAAWCRCKSGFKEDKSTGKCISECQNMICGDNAQCIVSPAGPTCVCLEGMMGNPFPGGKCNPVLCSTRNPCPGRTQTCENGQCVDTCNSKTCGLNARCDSDTRACVCSEGEIFIYCIDTLTWLV